MNISLFPAQLVQEKILTNWVTEEGFWEQNKFFLIMLKEFNSLKRNNVKTSTTFRTFRKGAKKNFDFQQIFGQNFVN